MGKNATLSMLRAGGFALLALSFVSTPTLASVIQSTVELPPAAGSYVFGSFCLDALGRCTVGAVVSGFTNAVHTQMGPDEVVTADALYTADIYTNNMGVPGTFQGTLIMPGTVKIIYEGRNPSLNPLGIFPTILDDFDFSGMLNGNTFQVKKNPAMDSKGTTSINPLSLMPPFTYIVDGSIEIFALYSFNSSPFMPAPGRDGTLAAIPEPQTALLAGLALAGLVGSRLKRL